jgi:rubrerythrin
MMDKENAEILNALKWAMQAETDGHYFYKMAASKTRDAEGKEALLLLAKDELDHYDFLKAQYDSIQKTGQPGKKLKISKPKGLTSKSLIFSKDFKKRIGKAHYEMSTLSIAIGLELSSMNFYRQRADETVNPALKDFFGKLADWEAIHHQILVREQTRLQEDYWIENRFYPF